MKVAITGAGGFLGAEFMRAFAGAGHETAGFARTSREEGVVCAELGTPLPDEALSGAELLVHCAWDLRAGTEAMNVEGTLRWHAQAISAGVRHQVFLTSLSAHPQSRSEYGRGKHAVERALLAEGVTVVRPGLVVGAGGLFGRMRRSGARMPVFPAPGGWDVSVSLVSLPDLTRVILDADGLGPGHAWNAFAPTPVPMTRLFRAIGRHFGSPRLVVSVPSRVASILLAAGATVLPALRAQREGFESLVASGKYGYSSHWKQLGLRNLRIEEMLAAAFPDL